MSTRQLADLSDPRLHTPQHHDGFVVRTTERWHERIDPNTAMRFRDGRGKWTPVLAGRDIRVDRDGAWIDQYVRPWDVADAVRIEGMADAATAMIEMTRPDGALVERDGDTYVLSAARPVLKRWLLDLELAIAKLEPADDVVVQADPLLPGTQHVLHGDEARVYKLRVTDNAAPLGTWAFSSKGGDWLAPLHGPALENFLHEGRTMKVGWRWSDMREGRVENVSGGKTFAALAGTTAAAGALAIAVGPIVLVAGALPLGGGGHMGGSGGGGLSSLGNAPIGGGGNGGTIGKESADWSPQLAPAASANAGPLFATDANVHSIIRPIVAVDAVSSIHRDYMSSGVSARLRFLDIIEIGGGTRETFTHGMAGWQRQTTGMFQLGLHLPLDAGFHYALPVGFEVGGGGSVGLDLRIPWGFRYSTGHWLATITPATPQYTRIDGEPHKWSLASGFELGTSF
jgi:hypothetical protein